MRQDLISRCELFNRLATVQTLGEAYAVIQDMPTIDPQRKTGKWIEDAETYYRAVNEKGGGVNENTPYFTDDIACSECLAKFSVIDNEAERFDFCPNCGSYNGGDKNDQR